MYLQMDGGLVINHRLIKIGSLLVILLVILPLVTYSPVPNVQPIEFVNTDIIDSTLGYVQKSETERAKYFFSSDAATDNSVLVQNTERIIQKSKSQFNLPQSNKSLKVYFNTAIEGQELPTNITTLSGIVLNTEHEFSLGGVVSYLSDYRLPAWLSAGLELYWQGEKDPTSVNLSKEEISDWLTEAQNKELPAFGDVWFIPDLIKEDELNQQAREISRLFVQYLNEEGYLQETVQSFIEESPTAFTDINKHWKAFTNMDDARIDCSYRYMYNYSEFQFEVHTDKAKYQFTEEDWDYLQVSKYVDYIEESIQYVERWFGYKFKDKLTYRLFAYSNTKWAGMASHSTIDLYDVYELSPLAAAHETVHAIMNEMTKTPDFPPFSEGLANVIMYEFEKDKHQYFYEWVKDALASTYYNNKEVNFKIIQDYNKFSQLPYDPNGEVDMYSFVYSNSCTAFDGWTSKFKNGFFEPTRSDYIEDLDGYNKVDSFVLYLLQKQGKEDFMKVYEKVGDFKKVYGIELIEMIAEWKTFIDMD